MSVVYNEDTNAENKNRDGNGHGEDEFRAKGVRRIPLDTVRIPDLCTHTVSGDATRRRDLKPKRLLYAQW